MRIGILSRGPTLYSTGRLVEAARRRGHRVTVIDTIQAARSLGVVPRASGRGYKQSLPRVDAIIPRIGASITRYGVAVVHKYEARGVVTTAPSQAIAQSRDKLRSLQLMQSADLPTPKTAIVSNLDQLGDAIDTVNGFPIVIKILRGTQGKGVILAPNLVTARAVLSIFFRHGHKPILVQEFIDEADGRDLRLLVIGDRCVAAMQRIAPQGDFRANLHRGATSARIRPDEAIEELALRAATLHRLGVAGVDIIFSQRGPLLLEVNSSPGLEGIETTTRTDIATEVVRYLEQRARERQRRPTR
ncbi:MAG: ATP-grasp domain-containing protein [Chloroflexota bacterium]